MKNNFKEPVLDVKEFIWTILSHWKAILLIALILGLTLPAIKHAGAMKQYKAQLENINNTVAETGSVDEQKDAILQSLNESDRAAVVSALKHRETIISMANYIQSSIWLNMNIYNERIVRLGYAIETPDKDKSEEIFSGFYSVITNDSLQAIGKAIGYEKEPEYIRELIYLDVQKDRYVGNYDTLVIQVAIPEEADVDTLKETVDQVMRDRSEKLAKNVAPNTFESLYCDEAYKVDSDAIARRYDTFSRLNTLQNNLKNAVGTMSVEQSAAYNKIVSIISTGADKKVVESDQTIDPPGYSKKYAVVGFAMGAFMYIIVLLLYMLFSGRILSGDSAAYYSDSRLIGNIYSSGKIKGINKLFHSKIVNRIRFGKTDLDKQLDKIIVSIEAIRDHYGLDRIPIIKLDDKATQAEKETFEKILERAKEKGLNLEILEATNTEGNINEKAIQAEDKVLLSLVGTHIKSSTLKALTEIVKCYDTSIAGTIFEANL